MSNTNRVKVVTKAKESPTVPPLTTMDEWLTRMTKKLNEQEKSEILEILLSLPSDATWNTAFKHWIMRKALGES